MNDLQDDIFQAECAISNLQSFIEDEGGTIQHTRDDVVKLHLGDGSFAEVNLAPIQRLLDLLRSMK